MSTEKMKSKTMDMDTLENAAASAGMSVIEFTELALYWMMDMCETDKEFGATEGRAFLHSSRDERGYFPPVYIGLENSDSDSLLDSQLEDVAKTVGLDKEEIPRFCLLWLLQMVQDAPHFTREAVTAWKETSTKVAQPLHPFMQHLFSTDLQAVHGSTFGEFGSKDVTPEHLSFCGIVERILSHDGFSEAKLHV